VVHDKGDATIEQYVTSLDRLIHELGITKEKSPGNRKCKDGILDARSSNVACHHLVYLPGNNIREQHLQLRLCL
jgi:hypothetical protein